MKLQNVVAEGQEAKKFSFAECRNNQAAKHFFTTEGEGAAEIKEVTVNGEKASLHRNTKRTVYTVLKVGDGEDAKLFYTADNTAFENDAFVDYVKPAAPEKPAKEAKAKPATFDKEASYIVDGDTMTGHQAVKKFGAKGAKEKLASGEITLVEANDQTASEEVETVEAEEAEEVAA
jgi:hypothetical protein